MDVCNKSLLLLICSGCSSHMTMMVYCVLGWHWSVDTCVGSPLSKSLSYRLIEERHRAMSRRCVLLKQLESSWCIREIDQELFRHNKPNKGRFANREPLCEKRGVFVNSEYFSWKSKEASQSPSHSRTAPIFVNSPFFSKKSHSEFTKTPCFRELTRESVFFWFGLREGLLNRERKRNTMSWRF